MVVPLLAAGCVVASESVGVENETGSGSDSATEGGAGATEAGTMGVSTTTTSGADSGTESGAESGGGIAPSCDAPAPNAFGGWALDLGDLPGADAEELDLALPCTIQGVSVDASQPTIQWELSCEDPDGVAHAVQFDVAASHNGPDGLAALVELPAELRVVGARGFGGVVGGSAAAVELAVANIALVGDGQVYGFVIEGPTVDADVFSPMGISVDRDACGVDPPEDDPDYPYHERDMSLTFDIAGESVTLLTGQWREMVVDGGATTDTITIDVLEATAQTCCHSDRWMRVVGRTYRAYADD